MAIRNNGQQGGESTEKVQETKHRATKRPGRKGWKCLDDNLWIKLDQGRQASANSAVYLMPTGFTSGNYSNLAHTQSTSCSKQVSG